MSKGGVGGGERGGRGALEEEPGRKPEGLAHQVLPLRSYSLPPTPYPIPVLQEREEGRGR